MNSATGTAAAISNGSSISNAAGRKAYADRGLSSCSTMVDCKNWICNIMH